MQILMVGGTRFVGRAVTEAALRRRHQVTLLHRGTTGLDLDPGVENLLADRDECLEILAGREFDATVDVCAYWPRQVHALADALAGRGGHHVYISSVSAYGDVAEAGADESAPLATMDSIDPDDLPITEQTYGPLKAWCEDAAAKRHERLTVVRPTYVVGPRDTSGRFTWWVDRLARGGRVLCPGPEDSPLQMIDARDQGDWIVGLVEDGVTGAFHSCSPEPPWSFRDFVESVSQVVGGPELEHVWVSADRLVEAGVEEQELPLWSGGARENALAMDPAAALGSGLQPRPLEETVRNTLDWVRSGADWRRAGVGLEPARESDLLSRLAP